MILFKLHVKYKPLSYTYTEQIGLFKETDLMFLSAVIYSHTLRNNLASRQRLTLQQLQSVQTFQNAIRFPGRNIVKKSINILQSRRSKRS